MSREYDRLFEIGREVTLLSHTGALLNWDQETYMPSGAVAERADQLAMIEGLIHDRLAGKEASGLLADVSAEEPSEKAFLRFIRREHERRIKLPKEFVMDMAREKSKAINVWQEAKTKNDFSLFAPHLETIVSLMRKKSSYLGYAKHPYDALIDEYEPGADTEGIRKVLATVESFLKTYVRKIASAPQVDSSFLAKTYPVQMQESFGRVVLEAMRFDSSRGRLDVSAHPFTTTLGSDDVRLTTRYGTDDFPSSLFSIIHEAGHGLYELGIASDLKGNLLATGTSLGMHESQSRFWENIIGRSLPFWEHFFPLLRTCFFENLSAVSAVDFFRAVNKVEPSLIRTEADEVTYNLHIILRFNLELMLMDGECKVKDLPALWNSCMKELLGITPHSDSTGVLQDIHWASGLFGYFPTYTLGNLYAAELYAFLLKDVPDAEARIREGDFLPILSWLRQNVHRFGAACTAEELITRISGASLDPSYFISYIEKKFGSIYSI
ncbi:MAG TPA: carboxypeptidase M32 [Spirochaetia bacterium]|nr:carboxypeptidase M32 [Spirochaetia bacterium]